MDIYWQPNNVIKASLMDMLTPILDRIVEPSDIRQLDQRDLERLSREVREEIISAASQTGGHFGAGLGVVELTVALHYVFNTPTDRLIWDVSHQAYPHKLLTGRRQALRSIRKRGGLYGFTKRSESEYDPFGAAHSSTSISAGLGMAVARDLKGDRNHVIAVIGDGAISGGMAYEAMNHAGTQGSRLIVIVNDNGMSIAPAVGALSRHLNELKSEARPSKGNQNASFFETLGFEHIGPIDGHDIGQLVNTLRALRNDTASTPIVVHVVTEKGKGHPFKKPDGEKYHAVMPFNPDTLEFVKAKAKTPSYTNVFASSLIDHARLDEKIVAITASMPSGTGLDKFAEVFPNRMFDVGIAEQHAVTFAAGMATEGMKPFCAIYSTFLQRGYDQVVHDVALQNLPVRFAIDRAGLVGQDGATHAGSFDLCYMSALPNMVVMAPSDAVELRRMVATAVAYDDGPIAFRYPRGDSAGTDDPSEQRPLEIGKGRIVLEGHDVAIINLGARMVACFDAAFELEQHGIATTLADARFAKPIDTDLIECLVKSHPIVVIVEEGSIGGFASHVLHHLAVRNLLGKAKILPLTLPDSFIAHGSPAEQYKDAGLDSAGIVERVLAALREEGSRRPLHLKSASATMA
jgi:1-deoxy-D-xylulose-5-phosphate synthase